MWRRSLLVALVAVVCARDANAACPTDCVGGGKLASTDCFVEFAGLQTADESCTDGDPGCDADGIVNGVCSFPLSLCLNVAGDPVCPASGLSSVPTVRPAKGAVAAALQQALAALDPAQPACTTPGVAVPLVAGLNGVKPQTVKLAVMAKSGSKRDRNKLRLTCRPSSAAPSFVGVIHPIFTARCALPACHGPGSGAIEPLLDAPDADQNIVNVPAANLPSLSLVHPGSVLESYLARKILGKKITDRTQRMPNGCPTVVPPGGCLTAGEIAAIVAWIQTGAPDN